MQDYRESGREIFFFKIYRNGFDSFLAKGVDIKVDKNTACNVYRWLREVCLTKLLATPIILGGEVLE